MNKKILLIFGFLILFLPGVVDAKTNTGLNYDAHEKFNYFYEQKNNTPFYNFLIEKGNTLPSYLGVSNKLFIYYADELKPFYEEHNHMDRFISDAKYVILSTPENIEYVRDGNSYKYNFYPYTSGTKMFWFDEDANYITELRPNFGFYFNMNYEIKGTDEESSANFSYMISSFYYSNSYIEITPSEEIIVTDIINDGERYLIDDNANYSSFIASIRKFFSFGGIKDYTDIVNTDISYFKTYPFTSDSIKVRSLYNLTSYGRIIDIPDGFSSLVLNSTDWGYIFIPKNINNSSLNRKLYTSTTESINIDKVSVWVNTYSLSGNNYNTPYDDTKLVKLTYKTPFTLYSIDTSKKLKEIDSSFNITDYITALTLQNYKYKPNIYYNTDAYKVCSVNSSCNFINPLTNEEITLTKDDIYNILSSNDSTGASVDIFDPADKQLEYAKEHSELYEYDEEGNIKGFNLSSVLKSIATFFTSFIGIITSIFSYFTLLFSALPIEIRSLFYFLLVGGILVILFKFMRG